jgi:XTP/dITP diphosphohydrolase
LMALLVVPLALDEMHLLTLHELEELEVCEQVMFEEPQHPLRARLARAGVRCGPFDDEPQAGQDGWGLVADPDSPRLVELAKAGARVTAGPARPPDSLSAAHAAPVARRAAAALADVVVVMARLRGPDGCPWDREQTHASLEVHLLEEAHEVLEAIDEKLLEADLEEELGDLLLQVAFHARIAEQDGRFDIAGIGRGLAGKLIHRHPHVFGATVVAGAAEVVANWEAIKAAEKRRSGPWEGVPRSLPALLHAAKLQKRAARFGFAPDGDHAATRIRAELTEPATPASIGEALFWLVALARAAGIDPEGALRAALVRFKSSLEGEPPIR